MKVIAREATVPDGDPFTVGEVTYREAAAYVASFVAYTRQVAIRHPEGIPVALVADGLASEDARVLR